MILTPVSKITKLSEAKFCDIKLNSYLLLKMVEYITKLMDPVTQDTQESKKLPLRKILS